MCPFEVAFSASDIVSLVLIVIEVKCFPKCTELEEYDIPQVLKAAFGWSGLNKEASSSIRKIVAKFVLIPKYVLSIAAYYIEWGLLYSESVLQDPFYKDNNFGIDTWATMGLSIAVITIFLVVIICTACCTDVFKKPKNYFKLLSLYRTLDLEMNIVLLWLGLKYDEVNNDSIVANLIIIYSSIEIFIGVIQLLKALFLLCRCYIHVSLNNISAA